MKILFLHGKESGPGGTKAKFLIEHGFTMINPALPKDDFEESLRIAQAAVDEHAPEVVVGSSRGGAVAMNINIGDAGLVLLAPAWRNWGAVTTVKPRAIVIHSRQDEIIPFSDSEALVASSPNAELVEIGDDHRLSMPEPLAAMLEAVQALRTTNVSPSAANASQVETYGQLAIDFERPIPRPEKSMAHDVGRGGDGAGQIVHQPEKTHYTSDIKWTFVEDAAARMFKIWTDGSELDWAKEAWGHLYNGGLTGGSTILEETASKLRLVALACIYQEFCGCAFDENPEVPVDNLAEDLEINPVALGILARSARDEGFGDYGHYSDLREAALIAVTEGQRPEIFQCLEKGYGGVVPLYTRLWHTRESPADEESKDDGEEFEINRPNTNAIQYVMNGFRS
jgi:hypothetical protein